MQLLIQLYEADNKEGMPVGWPARTKEVSDDFASKDVPAGWELVTLQEYAALKQPLQPAAIVAVEAAMRKDELERPKPAYVAGEVSLEDGRTGRLLVDAIGVVRFEETPR